MIFDFIKEKAIDKKESIHDGWLGTSILDRFLRLVGTIIVLGLGIIALTSGIDISPGGIDLAGWLLPVVIIFLILDVLFFHLVTPWIWSGITMLFGFLWGLIGTVFSMIGTLIYEIVSFAINIFGSILEFIITLGGSRR